LAFVADFGTRNFNLKTKFDMENNTSINHENGNDANRLLAAVRVQWYVSADIECPHCEHVNDFTTVDEWWNFTEIAENKTEFHYPIEFTCEECKKEFTVNGSDY
jgi:phage FluMu protein Com